MKSGLRVNVVGALWLVALLTGIAVTPDSPVADAAMRGDVDQVRTLIKQGADVNAAQGDGMTALHWAAERGDLEIAELLIHAGANVNAGTRIGLYTPLHVATKGGRAPVVKALLDAGSKVDAATTSNGATPLHLAAGNGNPEVIVMLLERGADVNARDVEWAQTPLVYAAGLNRMDAVKVLLAHGADLEATSKAVNVARMAAVDQEADRRRGSVLAQFRGKDVPEAEWRPTPTQLETAIRAAWQVQREATDVPAYQDRDLDVDEAADYPNRVGSWGGLTPLLHAVRQNHVQTVLALLDAGADINHVSAGDGTSPLLMAVLNGQFDLALQLVERGADVNLPSDAGTTPLYAAVERQWAPKSRYPQPQEHEQQRATYLDVMEALLQAGANPNARLSRHLWYMEYTFEHLRVDTRGATPLWRAAYGTDVEAVRLLAAYGADPTIPTIKPARSGFVFDDYAKDDLSGLPPIPEGGPAVYPIHAATGVGYGEGFAANHHRHAPDGWLPTVKFLVDELGADVNARDHNGYTALHHAASRGDNETILFLVSKGADVTLLSRRGQTTADMANGPYQRIQPFPETVALLEKLGSKNNHRCMSC